MYTQCKLQRDGATQVAWIENRGAIVGKHVEVKEDGLRWEVVEAYPMAQLTDKEIIAQRQYYSSHRDGTDI